jgi:hypothetical protein
MRRTIWRECGQSGIRNHSCANLRNGTREVVGTDSDRVQKALDGSSYSRADEDQRESDHATPLLATVTKAETQSWHRLEHYPEFLRRIEEARSAIRAGQGILLGDLK